MKRRAPGSEAITALESVTRDLAHAIEDARQGAVWVTTDYVSATTGRPRSTISRLCREQGEAVGARKLEGAWMIHWPTFEEFVLRDHQDAEKAA